MKRAVRWGARLRGVLEKGYQIAQGRRGRPTMDMSLDRLGASLGRLERATLGVGIRGEYLFADLALVGFARDVFEHGHAVCVLWESDVPRACYSPARSAFEACQEVMFLGTRTDDYAYWGARARARELLDWEYSESLAAKTDMAGGIRRTPTDEQLAEDMSLWSRFAPEMGALLEAAMSDTKSAKGPGRHHWTGKTRAELPNEFVKETGGDEQSVAIHRSYYNILSLHSHPSPRIETRSLRFEDGAFSFNISGDAAELAGAALAATYVATESTAVVIENRFPSRESGVAGSS